MLLIIEGCDGSGKTTLLETLRREVKHSFAILRMSQYPRKPTDVYAYLRWLERKPRGLHVVMDRHPLVSEPIYGPLIRKVDQTEGQALAIHLRQFVQDELCFVYCRPPDETILGNVQKNEHEQMDGVIDNTRQLIDRYDRSMNSLQRTGLVPKFVRYNYEVPADLEHLLALVNHFITKEL